MTVTMPNQQPFHPHMLVQCLVSEGHHGGSLALTISHASPYNPDEFATYLETTFVYTPAEVAALDPRLPTIIQAWCKANLVQPQPELHDLLRWNLDYWYKPVFTYVADSISLYLYDVRRLAEQEEARANLLACRVAGYQVATAANGFT